MFRDVLARMDLATAPVLALVGFFALFLGIGVWLLRARDGAHFERMNRLPLDDGEGRDG
jgi:cbb3-type cytochrome oxidase subunit 3